VPAGPAQCRLDGRDAPAPLRLEAALLQHPALRTLPDGGEVLLSRLERLAVSPTLAHGTRSSALRPPVEPGLEGARGGSLTESPALLILGRGLSGMATALSLALAGVRRITLIGRGAARGGLARSFERGRDSGTL